MPSIFNRTAAGISTRRADLKTPEARPGKRFSTVAGIAAFAIAPAKKNRPIITAAEVNRIK
jgi:hypothetical protein